jgi:hypothetical protein
MYSTPWVILSAHVFTRLAGDELDILETPHVETLAGFESWRKTVWGSERVRALGAVFFPVLATDDLYVLPGQVEAFRRECELLRANLEVVARAWIRAIRAAPSAWWSAARSNGVSPTMPTRRSCRRSPGGSRTSRLR